MRVGTRRSPAVTKATTTRTTERLLAPQSPRHARARSRNASRCSLPIALCLSACAARPAPPPAPPISAPAPLHRGPLTDYVSAAGLHWLALVKPRELLADPELARAIEQLVPHAHFDAFAEASGVDLRKVEHGAVGGWAYSTLYLAELAPDAAALARARFSERLLSGAATKHPHPGLFRITGIVGQTPETLLTIDERVLVVAVGDPVPAKVAEAYAEQRLKNSATALRGAALSALPDLSASNPAVLLASGPFADEWQSAANGLLQSTVALAIAAQPSAAPNDRGKVAVTICLAGAWGSSADDAANRLAAAWLGFARSSAGHLFELNELARVESSPDLLTLHVELELSGIVRGLKASVLRDLSDILRLPSARDKREPDKRGVDTP